MITSRDFWRFERQNVNNEEAGKTHGTGLLLDECQNARSQLVFRGREKRYRRERKGDPRGLSGLILNDVLFVLKFQFPKK